jgi:hypothetical protein
VAVLRYRIYEPERSVRIDTHDSLGVYLKEFSLEGWKVTLLPLGTSCNWILWARIASEWCRYRGQRRVSPGLSTSARHWSGCWKCESTSGRRSTPQFIGRCLLDKLRGLQRWQNFPLRPQVFPRVVLSVHLSIGISYISEIGVQSRCDIHVTLCNKEQSLLPE